MGFIGILWGLAGIFMASPWLNAAWKKNARRA
jgi:hypothetical protein